MAESYFKYILTQPSLLCKFVSMFKIQEHYFVIMTNVTYIEN